MMFEELRGKKVLITGASSGIGACTAELFAAYGAIVGIHYNASEKNAQELCKQIQKMGGDALLLKADLSQSSSWGTLIEDFTRNSSGLDALINNAGGIYGTSDFLDMDLESWESTITLNLTAPFFIAKNTFRYMKAHHGGRIINITSIAAQYGGSSKTIHYGAAKGGLESVTKALAREGAGFNILVNAIRPGVIDTPAHTKIGRSSLDERVKSIPLKRAGHPVDIARLCVFLVSDGGNYITGQVYGVTGGD